MVSDPKIFQLNERDCFSSASFLSIDIDVPERVMERRLLGLVRELEKEREEYLNQEALVKKQTDILANQFRNNATQAVAVAEAQAQLTRERAKANSVKMVETARIEGLKNMCTKLGISEADQVNHVQYLRTLREMPDSVKYSIDFTHAVAQQQPAKIAG